MKSGWFFGTPMWAEYEKHYYAGRERPEEYKSSPLADDHDFDWTDENRKLFQLVVRQTQVIDLTIPLEELWRGVRKSYRPLITRANEDYLIEEIPSCDIGNYQALHGLANGGQPRPDETYRYQAEWLRDGYGLLVMAGNPIITAAAYWILYQDCSYYMSGPSIQKNVQHAVVWFSLLCLKARHIRLVELGQIDGTTEKERNIGKFKTGFGGKSMPFTAATRRI